MKKRKKNVTRLTVILEDLKKQGINQEAFAEKIEYAASYVSNIKNDRCNPSMSFLLKVNEVYHYSIDYMLGKSDDMKDEASEILSALNKISDRYTTTPKTYTNGEGNEVEGKFLLLDINEHLYDFLVAHDHAIKLQQAQGLKSYDEEVRKIKQAYMKNKENGENLKCVLIPSNQLMEIVGSNNRQQQVMDEILNLGVDTSVYLDKEDI
jgi:transcriptional regulator with XRE-family HTH domain